MTQIVRPLPLAGGRYPGKREIGNTGNWEHGGLSIVNSNLEVDTEVKHCRRAMFLTLERWEGRVGGLASTNREAASPNPTMPGSGVLTPAKVLVAACKRINEGSMTESRLHTQEFGMDESGGIRLEECM